MDIRELPVLTAWIGLFAFTFQIYFDFSGYSDMAIGLGRMFGFHFLENFDYPYISKSITEFWRRWHISLSSWFKEYVYIPLGGNRKGFPKQIRNILIVWLLTGFWHGASWNFVAWGLYFGVLLIVEKLFLLRFLKNCLRFSSMFIQCCLSCSAGRSSPLIRWGNGIAYIRALFGGYGQPIWDGGRRLSALYEYRAAADCGGGGARRCRRSFGAVWRADFPLTRSRWARWKPA